MKKTFAEIVQANLLTPIIYRLEDEKSIVAVGFFDPATTIESIYETRFLLEKRYKKEVYVLDIRDFSEAERLDFMSKAELVYSETPLVKAMFETAMQEDFESAVDLKKNAVERDKKIGTIYLS